MLLCLKQFWISKDRGFCVTGHRQSAYTQRHTCRETGRTHAQTNKQQPNKQMTTSTQTRAHTETARHKDTETQVLPESSQMDLLLVFLFRAEIHEIFGNTSRKTSRQTSALKAPEQFSTLCLRSWAIRAQGPMECKVVHSWDELLQVLPLG